MARLPLYIHSVALQGLNVMISSSWCRHV